MPSAAVWSAVAATFSAISALILVWIQRINLIEAARPELVISEWSRGPRVNQPNTDVVRFVHLRNVGRGPALNVSMNVAHDPDAQMAAVMTTTRIPIIASGEAVEINGEIGLWWARAKPGPQGGRHIFVKLEMMCWDYRGMRHETRYHMMAVEVGGNVFVADEIAPGVMLHQRTTTSQPVWLLKVQRQIKRTLSRVPVVRRWFPQ